MQRINFDWQQDAACVGIPVDAFYTGSNEGVSKQFDDIGLLRKMCSACPVVSQCADYGIKHEQFGFFGGLTEYERSKIRGANNIILNRPEHIANGQPWS